MTSRGGTLAQALSGPSSRRQRTNAAPPESHATGSYRTLTTRAGETGHRAVGGLSSAENGGRLVLVTTPTIISPLSAIPIPPAKRLVTDGNGSSQALAGVGATDTPPPEGRGARRRHGEGWQALPAFAPSRTSGRTEAPGHTVDHSPMPKGAFAMCHPSNEGRGA